MHRRGRSRRPGHRNGLKPKQGAAPNCDAFFVYLGIAMPVIESRINPRSQAFIDNARALQEQVADLRAKLLSAAKGGSESARANHLARGKLLPRDRVERQSGRATSRETVGPAMEIQVG